MGRIVTLGLMCFQLCGGGASFSDLEVIGSFHLAGIDFQVKMVHVDGSYVALQLWDTAGQER